MHDEATTAPEMSRDEEQARTTTVRLMAPLRKAYDKGEPLTFTECKAISDGVEQEVLALLRRASLRERHRQEDIHRLQRDLAMAQETVKALQEAGR